MYGECLYECVCKISLRPLRMKKAVGIVTELMTTTTTRKLEWIFGTRLSLSSVADKSTSTDNPLSIMIGLILELHMETDFDWSRWCSGRS